MSYHQVQHTPSTASSYDGMSPAPSQSLISHRSLDLFVLNCLHSHGLEFDQWIESQLPSTPFSWYTASSLPTTRCISKLAWSRPPSASPNSLYYVLEVPLQSPLIIASKCISEFNWSWSPSVYATFLAHGLQVRMIMASMCICKLAQWQPPSSRDQWPPNSFDYGLPIASLSSHDLGR